MTEAQALKLQIDETTSVSALLHLPADARAAFVLAHSAGAGMNQPFLASAAEELAARGVAVLRYQFAYMEQGAKRPDSPPRAHAAVRAAVAEMAQRAPNLPLFAGGRSFGGRMTSQAQALSPLPNVRGLAFFAFPLHPAGKPGDERAKHLSEVAIPMLFIQGTRDDLADLSLLTPVVAQLAPRAELVLLDGADHAFHAPARSSGRTDAQRREQALDALTAWIDRLS